MEWKERRALTTQTIRLGSKGLGAELQLELIVLWSEREDVAKIIESDFMHDGTIDTGFYVLTRVWDRHQFSIHCHLEKKTKLISSLGNEESQNFILHFLYNDHHHHLSLINTKQRASIN